MRDELTKITDTDKREPVAADKPAANKREAPKIVVEAAGVVTLKDPARAARPGRKPGAVGAAIIAAGHKYGRRSNRGKSEYAQDAIISLYPAGIPKHLNLSKLTTDVDGYVGHHHTDFAATHGLTASGLAIDRKTVVGALALLRKAGF